MVFVSGDKLHAKTVPLFKRSDQEFVQANDLKADLRRLDGYFSAQPKEVLDRGLIHFEPPFDGDYLTTRLWKQFLPGWVQRKGDVEVRTKPDTETKLIDEFRAAATAPAGRPVAPGTEDFVVVKRTLPIKMGKWQVIAEDVVERDRAARAARSGGKEPHDREPPEASTSRPPDR